MVRKYLICPAGSSADDSETGERVAIKIIKDSDKMGDSLVCQTAARSVCDRVRGGVTLAARNQNIAAYAPPPQRKEDVPLVVVSVDSCRWCNSKK